MNGRTKPTKKARIEAQWEEGDELRPTGRWSRDHEWVEVEGGEEPTVWVHIGYFSEQLTGFIAWNRDYDKVKIRSKPFDGKVRGYLKKGEEIEILQVVMGWGRTPKGWIDLYYLQERGDDI